MMAKCPCDIFRKYVVNSNTGICKKAQQNEEKNIKTSPHGPQQFEHTPFRNTL
jgi:hypothetical protein